MDNIIEPNETFDFSGLSLAHPSGIQGGAYFTKIEYNKKPLYIQTTKSLTRQGIVKTGKKYYCDLMFDKNSEIIIHWLENLEEKCQKLIYAKRNDWFQGNLEENDVENAFNPLIRVYRSGKFYLLRTNIKNNKDDTPAVKIYNEKEVILTMDDVKPETEIISILEIQGIKFTSRNFVIETELKQIMILDNEPIFDNCIIKPNKKSVSISKQDTFDNKTDLGEIQPIDILIEEVDNIIGDNDKEKDKDKDTEAIQLEPILGNEQEKGIEKEIENIELNIDFEDLTEDIEEKSDELKELKTDDLHLEDIQNELVLKKPNQVYFDLYKEARNKAKQAKKNAILAYLEVKNIKKTYLIDNINDSDSDFDAEIEDVSESELEGL